MTQEENLKEIKDVFETNKKLNETSAGNPEAAKVWLGDNSSFGLVTTGGRHYTIEGDTYFRLTKNIIKL